MTVNSNGDYEALAKLLYPSIEASGNVYYGQTRKLTLDEVFDKNNGGFESHIESRKVADDSADYGFKYEKFFCWNLGPLSGELNIKNLSNTISDYNINEIEVVNFYKELPNYWLCTPGYTHSPATEPHIDNVTSAQGVIFAKYTINVSIDSVSNVINSGVYSTFEKSFVCNFQNYCLTNFYSPSNTNNWNVLNNDFFVDCTTDIVYLYIKLHSYFDSGYGTEIYDYPIQYSEPLTLTAVSGYVNLSIYNLCNNISQSRLYSYRINDGQWQNLQFYNGYASVTLQTNDRLQLYCRNFGEYSVHYTNNYTFSISANDGSSGYLIASGDARSVCTHFDDTSNISPNGIYLAGNCYLVNLFTNNTRLIAPPLLPSFKVWATYDTSSYKCYALMFRGCTNLKSAPELPGVTVDEYAYRDMFYGCTSLQNTPVLHHSVNGFTFNQTTYLGMFNGCTNLNAATAFFNVDEVINIQDFLTDVSSSGVLTTNATWQSGSIPIGWAISTVDYYSVNEEIAPLSGKNNKLITSGSSLSDISYGRGDVTDVSTKYNMLTTNPLSDENAPEMNSYSSDGSYNQDIFGWKCFNSPVSFRNGIYGECGSLTTYKETGVNTHYGIVLSTYTYTDQYDNNKLCSISMCTCGDDPTISEIIIHADNIKLDGNPDFTANKAKKLVDSDTDLLVAYKADQYGTPNHVSINGNLSPRTTGLNLNIGSSSNPFGSIYANNIFASLPLGESNNDFKLNDIQLIRLWIAITISGSHAGYSITLTIKKHDTFSVASSGKISSIGNLSVGGTVNVSDGTTATVTDISINPHDYASAFPNTTGMVIIEPSFIDDVDGKVNLSLNYPTASGAIDFDKTINAFGKTFKCLSNADKSTGLIGNPSYTIVEIPVVVTRIE